MTHSSTQHAIFLPPPEEPAGQEPPAVLPPFTGTGSVCAKCRFNEAYTYYRPANARLFTEWNGRQQVRGPLPERLERQCQRCDFQWEEALVPSCGYPAAGEEDSDPGEGEISVRDLVLALDDSCAYPLEIHPDALAFVATSLLERVRAYRRPGHPLWQTEQEPPSTAVPEPAPAPEGMRPSAPPAPAAVPAAAVVPIPLGQRQQPPAAPAGPTAYAQAAEG